MGTEGLSLTPLTTTTTLAQVARANIAQIALDLPPPPSPAEHRSRLPPAGRRLSLWTSSRAARMLLVSPLPSASHPLLTSVCSTSRTRAAGASFCLRSSACSVLLRRNILCQSLSMHRNTCCFLHSPVNADLVHESDGLAVRVGRALAGLEYMSRDCRWTMLSDVALHTFHATNPTPKFWM